MDTPWNARSLPLEGSSDVVVVGGGIAGVAAALAAARAGARVALLEKSISLGGLATLGNVVVYLPLCDGTGRQVIGGIAQELLELSAESSGRGAPGLRKETSSIPECWTREASREERSRRRFRVDFNPASFILALEELILAEGIELVYDCRFVDASVDDGRVTGLILAEKRGISLRECRGVVDATGDADVCAAAGERIVECSTNVACGWFYYTQDGEVKLHRLSQPFAQNPDDLPESGSGFGVSSLGGVTGQVLESRKLTRRELGELQAANPEATIHPLMLPQVASFRMTRRLRGIAEPTAEEALSPSSEVVGLSGDWRRCGPVYHLALGSLRGRTRNLLAAGRCISVGNDLWDATRAIPCCALTGEAAGAAAALSLNCGSDLNALDTAALQQHLRDRGGILSI